MRQGPVFYDPKGKRQRVVASSGGVAGLVVAVVSTLFVISLFGASLSSVKLPGSKGGVIPTLKKPDVPSGVVTGNYRKQLIQLIAASRKRPTAKAATAQRIIGFYNQSDAGYQSFTENVGVLSHFMPQWIRLRADGAGIVTDDLDYDHNLADIKVRCKANGTKLEPILTNYEGHEFSAVTAHRFFSSPLNMDHVAAAITKKLLDEQMDGLNVDIEDVAPADRMAFVQFLNKLHTAFQNNALELSIDLEVQAGVDWQVKYIAPCDFGVLMAYDEHDENGPPGPISSWGFVGKSLRTALTKIPANKIVLGIGAYCLDWPENGVGDVKEESFQEALTAANDNLESGRGPASKGDQVRLGDLQRALRLRGRPRPQNSRVLDARRDLGLQRLVHRS